MNPCRFPIVLFLFLYPLSHLLPYHTLWFQYVQAGVYYPFNLVTIVAYPLHVRLSLFASAVLLNYMPKTRTPSASLLVFVYLFLPL